MIFHKRCGWGAARWKEIATWGFSLLNQFCDSGSWQNKLLKQNYFDGFFISKEDRTVCSRASGRPAQINTDLVALMKLHRAQYKKQPKNKSAIKTKLWLWVANFVVVYHDSTSIDSAALQPDIWWNLYSQLEERANAADTGVLFVSFCCAKFFMWMFSLLDLCKTYKKARIPFSSAKSFG